MGEYGTRQSVTSSLVPAVDSSAVTRFVQGFVRKVSAPLWTEARRRATKRLVFGESAPFFALVGVTLVSGSQQGLVTKEDELEALCCNVRVSIHLCCYFPVFHNTVTVICTFADGCVCHS